MAECELSKKWRDEVTVTMVREERNEEVREKLAHSLGLLHQCADELDAWLAAHKAGEANFDERFVYDLWMKTAAEEPPHLSDEFWSKFTERLNAALAGTRLQTCECDATQGILCDEHNPIMVGAKSALMEPAAPTDEREKALEEFVRHFPLVESVPGRKQIRCGCGQWQSVGLHPVEQWRNHIRSLATAHPPQAGEKGEPWERQVRELAEQVLTIRVLNEDKWRVEYTLERGARIALSSHHDPSVGRAQIRGMLVDFAMRVAALRAASEQEGK